jgi:exodeoxyribonuclease VII small subunit
VTSDLTFETAQRELEQVVAKLEGGKAEVEEALALWQRGDELYRYCVEQLESAEGRIEELGERVQDLRP